MVCNKADLEAKKNIVSHVLILILLEYGLQLPQNPMISHVKGGLNPYSTGIWSATAYFYARKEDIDAVLILILLEYGLQHISSMV